MSSIDTTWRRTTPAPPKKLSAQDIYISVDTEWWELKHKPLLEIGVCIYDGKASALPVPDCPGSPLLGKMSIHHMIFKGNAERRNGQFVPDHTDNCIVAGTVTLPFSVGQIRFYKLIDYYYKRAKANQQNLVFIGHDFQGDLKTLREAGFLFGDAGDEVEYRDTQKIWKQRKLSWCLDQVKVEHRFLHNAANDAYFTLLLYFCLTSRSYMQDILDGQDGAEEQAFEGMRKWKINDSWNIDIDKAVVQHPGDMPTLDSIARMIEHRACAERLVGQFVVPNSRFPLFGPVDMPLWTRREVLQDTPIYDKRSKTRRRLPSPEKTELKTAKSETESPSVARLKTSMQSLSVGVGSHIPKGPKADRRESRLPRGPLATGNAEPAKDVLNPTSRAPRNTARSAQHASHFRFDAQQQTSSNYKRTYHGRTSQPETPVNPLPSRARSRLPETPVNSGVRVKSQLSENDFNSDSYRLRRAQTSQAAETPVNPGPHRVKRISSREIAERKQESKHLQTRVPQSVPGDHA